AQEDPAPQPARIPATSAARGAMSGSPGQNAAGREGEPITTRPTRPQAPAHRAVGRPHASSTVAINPHFHPHSPELSTGSPTGVVFSFEHAYGGGHGFDTDAQRGRPRREHLSPGHGRAVGRCPRRGAG